MLNNRPLCKIALSIPFIFRSGNGFPSLPVALACLLVAACGSDQDFGNASDEWRSTQQRDAFLANSPGDVPTSPMDHDRAAELLSGDDEELDSKGAGKDNKGMGSQDDIFSHDDVPTYTPGIRQNAGHGPVTAPDRPSGAEVDPSEAEGECINVAIGEAPQQWGSDCEATFLFHP